MKIEKLIEWNKLKENFFQKLCETGYSPSYMRLLTNTLVKLEKFMAAHNEGNYSIEIGKEFLMHESNLLCSGHHSQVKSAINRLNDFYTGREFRRVVTHVRIDCPSCFQEHFELYIQNLKLRGLRESSISRYKILCINGLISINNYGINTLADIKSEHILKAFESVNDKPVFVTAYRSFLKFLYDSGLNDKDLSICLPTMQIPQLIPSIYSKSEITDMIDSIDKSTNIGKRDYAVILLALRLGIRRGDISNLKLVDVDFESKRIRFIQEKTGVPQNLLLPSDVEIALTDYIETARPKVDLPYVFLKVKAPISRLYGVNLYNSVNKYVKKAGIDIGNRKCGPHSLRATLASELVAEKVPYSVVRHILGQEHPDATRHYVKFDIEMLRTCALEVPEPTGFLAEALNIGGVI